VHHFHRAAADIGQDAIGVRNAAEQAVRGKCGLLFAGQHAHAHAGQGLLHLGHETGAVGGIAHRGGGQDVERLGAHGARQGMVAAQHHDRLFQAFVVQAAGLVQAATQAQHGFFVEDRGGIAAATLEHHQAHRVGAEVDDGGARGVGEHLHGVVADSEGIKKGSASF
jgi:hypothetical protein